MTKQRIYLNFISTIYKTIFPYVPLHTTWNELARLYNYGDISLFFFAVWIVIFFNELLIVFLPELFIDRFIYTHTLHTPRTPSYFLLLKIITINNNKGRRRGSWNFKTSIERSQCAWCDDSSSALTENFSPWVLSTSENFFFFKF